MKSILDLKRAYRFFLYKSDAQKKRTHNRTRSHFSRLKKACDELNDKRIGQKLFSYI
jgi:hypothetical protein